MLALTVDVGKLKRILTYGGVFVDECKLQIKEGCIEMSAIDERQIGMMSVVVEDDVFDSFESKSGTAGLPIGKLIDVLEIVGGDSSQVRLYIDDDLEDLSLSCNGLDYTMKLVNPDVIDTSNSVDDLSLGATIVLPGDIFNEVVTGMGGIYSFVEFKFDEETESAELFAENKESTFNPVLSKDELLKYEMIDCNATYRVEYLDQIRSVVDDELNIAIQSDDEHPARIKFKTDGGNCSTEYVLAPRVDTGA